MPRSDGQYSTNVPLFRDLDTNGDGTGTANAIGNYTVAGLGPTEFFIAPPAGVIYVIEALAVHVGAKTTFAIDGYAGIASPGLPVGYTIDAVVNGATIVSIPDNGTTLKQNADFPHLAANYTISTYASNYNASTVSLDARDFGFSLRLNGDNGDRLRVILNDDFSTLIDHHFTARGYE